MENGMILLTITATLTSLVTEALKKTLNLSNKTTSMNIIVAVVSVVCSLLVSFGYIILTDIAVNMKTCVYILTLSILSWITACSGYDRVIQLLKQIDVTKINKCIKED